MGQDLANELLQVVKEGLKEIREQLEKLRGELAALSERYMRIENDCELCRSNLQNRIALAVERIAALEAFKKSHEKEKIELTKTHWTTATKVITSFLALIGMVAGALISTFFRS